MPIPCTHQAPQSCPDCNGQSAERRGLTRAERDEMDRDVVRWWLRTCPRTPTAAPAHDTNPTED